MAIKKAINKKSIVQATPSLLDRMESEVQSNQSRVSLILGGLIVLVIGVLIFNYFNKSGKPEITPSAEQTENKEKEDISPEKLPGKYTVKEGDTLFNIAQKYYSDGYKYIEISKANGMASPDLIEVGQVLDIPKIAITSAPEQTLTPVVQEVTPTQDQITANKYTVITGDWLSTIAARAYNGDIMAYNKIAIANNIINPDLIEPGMILTIPR